MFKSAACGLVCSKHATQDARHLDGSMCWEQFQVPRRRDALQSLRRIATLFFLIDHSLHWYKESSGFVIRVLEVRHARARVLAIQKGTCPCRDYIIPSNVVGSARAANMRTIAEKDGRHRTLICMNQVLQG